MRGMTKMIMKFIAFETCKLGIPATRAPNQSPTRLLLPGLRLSDVSIPWCIYVQRPPSQPALTPPTLALLLPLQQPRYQPRQTTGGLGRTTHRNAFLQPQKVLQTLVFIHVVIVGDNTLAIRGGLVNHNGLCAWVTLGKGG